ncbi:MAG: hypothetical protein J5679_02575 [Alphaproteobacteria bacterium]|nr:hypothetical protein [Alphaproteobacteria bacterium]
MELATLSLLKYSAATESVSVEHYPAGDKCYSIPVLSMLFIDDFPPDADMFDMSNCYVDCSYKMSFGFPTLQCRITIETEEREVIKELENISIPLNPKKQNTYQRKIVALINACSKRIIEQEMKRNKIALAAVAHSTLHNNLYN